MKEGKVLTETTIHEITRTNTNVQSLVSFRVI